MKWRTSWVKKEGGDNNEGQSELPKKRKVSYGGKKNKLILAKAGSQPYQN